MISASSFYLFNFKQNTEPIRFMLQDVIIPLAAGYYYPTTVLPHPLQVLASFIPHTYALDALRRLVVPGGDLARRCCPCSTLLPLSPIAVDVLALVGHDAARLSAGLVDVRPGHPQARREGTLTRWQ